MKQSLNLFLMAFLIVTLPGCWWRKKASCKSHCTNKVTTVNMPLGANRSVVADNESISGFFETEGDSFDMLDQNGINEAAVVAVNDTAIQDDFAWINTGVSENSELKAVHFDFDDSSLRADQKPVVVYDAKMVEKTIATAPSTTIVVEGHACHSAGSRTYNLAKSEARAKAVAKELVAQGVEAEHIKTVGRGAEMPAIVHGKRVEGNRQQQWPNRRVELHAVNA